jgi:hypothetical protein
MKLALGYVEEGIAEVQQDLIDPLSPPRPCPPLSIGPSCRPRDRSANCHLQPRRTPRREECPPPFSVRVVPPFPSEMLFSIETRVTLTRRSRSAHDLLRDRLHLARIHHRRGCPSAKTRRKGLRILRASLANYQEPLGFRSHGFAPCFSLPHTNMLTIDLSNASFDASSPSDDTSCYPSV